jgi:uncharacterized membrane protein YccC
MVNNHHGLTQGDGTQASHALREWLRRHLFGDTGLSLDRPSLIFGAIFFVSMAIAAIVAVILGFGTAAILAALSAMFMLIAAIGGPLRSDLRMMAWFGPSFILAVGGLHFLTTVSLGGTIAVIVMIVFLAGLLPAFSSRYTTVGSALVLGVLIGFGLRLPGNLPAVSIFGAIAVSVIVIALVRLVLGVGDPSLITRKVIAHVLTDANVGAIDTAWKTLRAVRAEQWMSEALSGAEAYCVARLILTTRLEHLSQADALRLRSILEEADNEARELVGLIEAKQAPTTPNPAPRAGGATAQGLPPELQAIVANLWRSLDKVRGAALKRERASTTIAPVPGTSLSDTCRALFSWDSSILWHALRCAMVVLVALVIASLHLGNPLNTTFLTATFVIMHPTPLGTAAKALQRTVGAIIGGGIAGGLALVVSPTVLLPLALLALFLAFPFMLKNITIYYAMIAVMTLLLGISTKSLPASAGLLEYLLYIVIAAAIALLVIIVVPTMEPNAVKRTLKAMAAVRTLLLTISAQGSASRRRDDYILAARAVQNLLAAPGQLAKASQQSRDLTAQVANALQKMLADVSTLKFRPVAQSILAAEVSAAEQLLNLDEAMDSKHVTAGVRQSTPSRSELQQSWLVIDALAARQSAKQLLALERVAKSSR